MKKLLLHPNFIGIFILATSFFVSLWIVVKQTGTIESMSGREQRVVRFLHWQLEPGFRESLQVVIDEYNALPHVVESGYTVEQIAISEKFYPQFLNVHLISGTAPDLATRGKASLVSQTDQFFEPLGAVVNEPNYYNTEETIPHDLDPAVRDLLINGPWRETFIDGMQSGYEEALRNYYAIPVSNWGPVRLYFNRGYMRRAKDLLLAHFNMHQPLPGWMQKRLIPNGGSTQDGYLPDTPELREWLRSDQPPNTLGRLLLVCDAIWELARVEDRPFLVPISGSSYTRDSFADRFAPTFHHSIAQRIDLDLSSSISQQEIFGGWASGMWHFEDPSMIAYFEVLRDIAAQFPRGFLGLDREQANRRFIMQNAAMLFTGAWDASSIFKLAEDQADSFEVGVTPLPVPGPGERYYEQGNLAPSEAAQGLGVPMALYKLSPVKDEAIDFLRFLTSYYGNKKFSTLSGWLPATIGVQPSERMQPFMPVAEGVTIHYQMAPKDGNVGTEFRGQMYLLIGGDIDYPSFVENVEAAMSDPRMGVDRQWFQFHTRDMQGERNVQMSMTTQALQFLSGDSPESQERYYQILLRSLANSNAQQTPRLWQRFFPEEPFPQF